MSTNSSPTLTSSTPSSSSSVQDFSFTSFVTPALATALNSPQQTQTQQSQTTSNQDGIPSAALYLYLIPLAFATLFCICIGVILRYVLLRRRQRMLEQFLSSGAWPPPEIQLGLGLGSGSTLKRKRPKMWEAYVGGHHGHESESRVYAGKLQVATEWDWDSIRPLSAAYVHSTPPSSFEMSVPANLGRRWVSFHPLETRWKHTPSSASAPETETASPSPQRRLRIAVLIAMPQPPFFPSSSKSYAPSSNDCESEFPHLEFGVSEIEFSSNHGHHDLENKVAKASAASGNEMVEDSIR